MPAILNVIFIAIFVVIATAIAWAIWSVVALSFARRKKRWIVVGLPACLVGVLVSGAAMIWWSSRPQSIFEREFGFAAPADVRFIDSSTFMLGDSSSAYLHFTATTATIAKCVAGAALSSGDLNFRSDDRPRWFTPSIYSPTVYSRQDTSFDAAATRPTHGFASEFRILQIDGTGGNAWYEFVGVD